MNRKRLFKYGAVVGSVALAALYRQEINDVSIGVLRFGRAAVTVSSIDFLSGSKGSNLVYTN